MSAPRREDDPARKYQGTEPTLKDVISAHVGGKLTWEEASDLSPDWNDRAGAAHGVSTRIAHRGKNVPNIRPTSDSKISKIHKNAGLK